MSDAVEVVRDSFAEAKQMLMEHAEEMGIDLEAGANDPEVEAIMRRTREAVESQEAIEIAKNYSVELKTCAQRERRMGERH